MNHQINIDEAIAIAKEYHLEAQDVFKLTQSYLYYNSNAAKRQWQA